MRHEYSLTIPDFCAMEGIEETTYFALQAAGRGPREMFLGGTIIRISAEARRDWHREREKETERPDHQAVREALRARARRPIGDNTSEYILKFCSGAFLLRLALRGGKPWFCEEESTCYFTVRDLAKFLGKQDVKLRTNRGYLAQTIREMGGDRKTFNFDNKYSVSAFWVPFKREDVDVLKEKEPT